MKPEALRVQPYGSVTIHSSEVSSELKDMFTFEIVHLDEQGENIVVHNRLSRDIVINRKPRVEVVKAVKQKQEKQ